MPSLNILLTSTAGATTTTASRHQGPGLIQNVITTRGDVGRVYLPPDANCLLSVADHCFRSRVLRQPDRHRQAAAAAVADDGRGDRALRAAAPASGMGRHRRRHAPTPTSCWPAPATSSPWRPWPRPQILREQLPQLADPRRQRRRPDGAAAGARTTRTAWTTTLFGELFTDHVDVVFAFHGYPGADPPARARPARRRPLPRARLHRGGHDDDAVRHGRAQPGLAATTS